VQFVWKNHFIIFNNAHKLLGAACEKKMQSNHQLTSCCKYKLSLSVYIAGDTSQKDTFWVLANPLFQVLHALLPHSYQHRVSNNRMQ
jgi:hypothetical protein